MNRNLIVRACVVFVAPFALAAIVGCGATPKAESAAPPLPPGWTQADMDLMMSAGTPGAQQELLLKNVGSWSGTSTMVMAPGAPPQVSPCSCTISSMMNGRYTQMDFASEMPGMGPFKGFGISGYDNATQKYVTTWVDDMSTGILRGTGERSADGKTMTWHYTYYCPIRKKDVTMWGADHITGPNTMTMEMHGSDPKSGVEYKMMQIDLTRK